MKKCNRKFLAVAVAGALTAATAVPALALENEFHGAITSFYNLSNFSATGVLADDPETQNYFVQRVRLGYDAKASDHVKMVSKFEFDYNYWGNSSYATGRGTGGAIGADSINMETKNLYLDVNYPAIKARIGMQSYTDAFKGVMFDADMAGILFSHDYSNAGVSAGFFRFGDTGATLGRNSYDMLSLDARYNISKQFKVGGAYYYISDNRATETTTTVAAGAVPIGFTATGTPIYAPAAIGTATIPHDAEIHTFGVNAEGTLGPVTLTGFAMLQRGDLTATKSARGYAFNLGARAPLAGGTLRTEALYVEGGDNEFYIAGGAGGTEGGGFYDSEMTMLNRNKYATSIDNAIIYDVNNLQEGVIMAAIGYDYPVTSKLSASANVGFAAVAENLNARNTASDSDYLGTEINFETNYQLSPNLMLGARGGYVILGDYFDGLNADNPYDLKIIARYAF